MEAEQSRKRRRYSAELKAQIIAECLVPGVSVAKVALAHGINANILHGWRKLVRGPAARAPQREFIPVAVAPMVQGRHADRNIELELHRGAVTLKLQWPLDAAAELAAFTRELLR